MKKLSAAVTTALLVLSLAGAPLTAKGGASRYVPAIDGVKTMTPDGEPASFDFENPAVPGTSSPVPEGGMGFFFETDPVDEGWTWEGHDDDTFDWMWFHNIPNLNYPEGKGMMNSRSYDNDFGALTPDNWLISPVVPGGGSVSFMIVSQDPDFPGDPIGVYASGDGGKTWSDGLGYFVSTADVQTCEVDLSDYAGMNIKLAFRHYDATNIFSVNLDAVIVTPAEELTRVPGDYDCSDEVNVQDAILTLRASMNLITPSAQSLLNADMDGDGVLKITDALTVLRMAMDLI